MRRRADVATHDERAMDAFQPTLDDLIFELRSNSDSDKAFAQRVASACAHIADFAEVGSGLPAPAAGQVHYPWAAATAFAATGSRTCRAICAWSPTRSTSRANR